MPVWLDGKGSKENRMDSQQFKTLSISRATRTSLAMIAFLICSMAGPAAPAYALPGDLTRVSVSSSEEQANGRSNAADISGDGRYVVFRSEANDLVLGDTNGVEDIFLRDTQAGDTT